MSKAREIAEERLARGEITQSEFETIIKNLSPSRSTTEIRETITTPYSTPKANLLLAEDLENGVRSGTTNLDELEYVGFWPRTGATLIDWILIFVLTAPLVTLIYGTSYWTSEQLIHGPIDFFITYLFPAIVVILFWVKEQATPGKMAVSAKIVDVKTGNAASTGQLVGRYFSYFLSGIPIGLGFIWVAFDDRKQGWHDKLAGTVVIRSKNRLPKPVEFK